MISIAFCNRKGGSGKTTTAVHVAAGLALRGKKVIIVDTDPQAHASLWLSKGQGKSHGLYEVLYGTARVTESLLETHIKGLYLLSAHEKLADFEAEHVKRPGSAHLLKKVMAPCRSRFEYIIFDTPPYLGLMMVSVLLASSSVFLTVPLQFLAIESLEEMAKLINKVNSRAGDGVKIQGIVPVMVNRQLKGNQALLKRIRQRFGKECLFPYIRQNVRLAEAPASGTTIYRFAPGSNGAYDYWCLTKAIDRSVSKLNQ